jgi:hypothetical protein
LNAQATWKEVGRIETKLGSYHAGDAEDSTVTFSLPQQAIPKLPEPIPEANLPADAAPPQMMTRSRPPRHTSRGF